MANLSSRQQRRIRRNIAENLVSSHAKRRKIDCDDNTDFVGPSSVTELQLSPSQHLTGNFSKYFDNVNESSNSGSDDNQYDHDSAFADKFTDIQDSDEDNNYSDCSEVNVLECGSCYNIYTGDDCYDYYSSSDTEISLNDVSTSSINDELGVVNEHISIYNSSSNSGSSDDDSEQIGCKTVASESLYQGASLSRHEFAVAYLSLVYHHNLTYSCGGDVLKFLSQILPVPNSVSQTYLTLTKGLVNYDDSTKTHRCCGYCTIPLIDQATCEKTECKAASLPDSTFVEVCLDKQLNKLCSGKEMYLVPCHVRGPHKKNS